MTRTLLAAIFLAVLLVVSGCAGVPTIDDSADGPTESPSSTPAAATTGTPATGPTPTQSATATTVTTATTTAEPRAAYPGPPSNLSNDTVEADAIEYEEARLHDELRTDSELEYFDVGYIYSPTATVLNRSDGGVYVEVAARYSYGTDEAEADGVPVQSLYVVDEREIRRVAALD